MFILKKLVGCVDTLIPSRNGGPLRSWLHLCLRGPSTQHYAVGEMSTKMRGCECSCERWCWVREWQKRTWMCDWVQKSLNPNFIFIKGNSVLSQMQLGEGPIWLGVGRISPILIGTIHGPKISPSKTQIKSYNILYNFVRLGKLEEKLKINSL